MRPAEFTQEQIIKAGQELQAAGRRKITGFALRQRVGGGNPARLKLIWDEHINGQSVMHAEPVAEEVAGVTQALTERLLQLAVELNDKAVKAGERRVAEMLRSADEVAAVRDEKAAAESRVEQLTEELADVRREVLRERQGRIEAERQVSVLAARLVDADKRGACLQDRLIAAQGEDKEVHQIL